MVTRFSKKDLFHVQNLLRALKKAKMELDGMECLAHSETLKWVSGRLLPLIDQESKLSEAAEKMEIIEDMKPKTTKSKKTKKSE